MESKDTIRAAKVLIVAGGILLLGIVVGFILSGSLTLSPVSQAKDSVTAASDLESPFTQIAERVLPAVVTIEAKRTVDGGGNAPQFNFEGPYGDFFKRLFPEAPKTPHPMKIPSSGSGFIFEKDGLILTNNHVVRDASEITVILNDKRKLKAKIVGTDPSTDVAVIKISADGDLPPCRSATRTRSGSGTGRSRSGTPSASWTAPSPWA